MPNGNRDRLSCSDATTIPGQNFCGEKNGNEEPKTTRNLPLSFGESSLDPRAGFLAYGWDRFNLSLFCSLPILRLWSGQWPQLQKYAQSQWRDRTGFAPVSLLSRNGHLRVEKRIARLAELCQDFNFPSLGRNCWKSMRTEEQFYFTSFSSSLLC